MNNIFVIGDLHGYIKPVKSFYNTYKDKIKENDTLICLGDFGANFFFNKKDWAFKHQLSKMPFIYFVIRGNHEARPSVCFQNNLNNWHTESYFENTVYVENEFPNIKYALDKPAAYNIDGFKTLVYPGAYSIDKWYRLENGFPWFSDEQMNHKEMEIGEELAKSPCDIVLSHTCPSTFVPNELFIEGIDPNSVDHTTEMYLGHIEYILDYKAWLWGHFHAFKNYSAINGQKHTMLFNDYIIELHDYMKNDNFFLFGGDYSSVFTF